MRLFAFFSLLLALGLFTASPAFAAPDEAPPPKKAEVPFREDAGLINAEYYLSNGKYAQAIEVLNTVLQRHPSSADGYTYRGYAFLQLGDANRAKDDFAKAIIIDPTHLGANKYIATLYLREGDLDRALDELRVIRMVCAGMDCQEEDELEADINRYRSGQREAPPVSKKRKLVPDSHLYYQER